MKVWNIILFTVLLLSSQNSTGQSEKELEAIARYQLAEEAYSSTEYDKALLYLEQAEKIIGRKPKLLYLQITIELDKGYNNLDRVKYILDLISKFENAPGISDFSKDKKTITARNKVMLKEKQVQLTAELEKLKIQKQQQQIKSVKGKAAFEKFAVEGLALGLPLEEFEQQYPNFMPKNYKLTKTNWGSSDAQADIIYICHSKNINFENKNSFLLPYNASTGAPLYGTDIHALIVKDRRVVGLQKNLFYYNSKGSGSLTHEQAAAEITKYVQDYKNEFESGGDQTDAIEFAAHQDSWKWSHEGKSVILFSDNYVDEKNAKRWKCSLTVRIIKQ